MSALAATLGSTKTAQDESEVSPQRGGPPILHSWHDRTHRPRARARKTDHTLRVFRVRGVRSLPEDAGRDVPGDRVLSDNGSAYRSYLWRDTWEALSITPKRTQPCLPQTNGKVERFHHTMAEGWAYAHCYRSERTAGTRSPTGVTTSTTIDPTSPAATSRPLFWEDCGRYLDIAALRLRYGMMTYMKKPFALLPPLTLAAAITLTGCSESVVPDATSANGSVVDVEVPEEEPATPSFHDSVFTTPDFTITLTDYRVIPGGQEGNEHGDVPVLAIWYDTTNLGTSDTEVSPMTAFVMNFAAFQDNDPNIENSLRPAPPPDDAFLETQLAQVKPGGTVAHAVAYKLTDTTTPVELVAGRMGEEYGRMTFNLN